VKGKVVPLKPRTSVLYRYRDGQPWGKIVEYVQPQAGEMEICLQREIDKAPLPIKDTLQALAQKGERHCPILFLVIARLKQSGPVAPPRLAASLEALHLALKVHQGLNTEAKVKELSLTEAILTGDYYFSLALTLAGEIPVFIKGMSEIIARVVSCEIGKPTRHVYFQAWRKAYLKRVSDGCASIIALAATLGAWYAGLEPWQNEALAFFGHYLGMGFHLKKEQDLFERRQGEKNPDLEITLPLIHMLEQSPRRGDLLALLNKPKITASEKGLLLKECKKVDPGPYMDTIVSNCFSKAAEFLELLHGSIAAETLETLKNFSRIRELV
jgi:geranylgeranyl pyrophosphate synthase